ncbi:transcriptional regulator FilR1 domain-containing protein [Halorubrum tebenquichense]|uniref:Methanogenesis regulatory protein FilR1 middle domain-containing protein n=1 Tax=Halorubrum tebenquichense DSM 14210 TaxID=1227485 RepID=M0E0R4_9EURY|nr:hypothetical protein [Halorubrum tebenquichense]ELZ41366.1 hypothetical protein C472_00987 [Halorubrum tebenquichense DSM 14210]
MSDDDAEASSASPAAVLRSLVAKAVGSEPAALDEQMEVVEREPGAADGEQTADPAERLAELVGAADSVVAVVPRFDADLARRLNASLSSAESDDGAGDASDATVPNNVRAVFTDAASDRLGGATGPVVRRALAERGVDAYRHDGESPVAVVLADDRAAVGLVDGDGLSALLWTDAPAVREWAAATCRRYLNAAEPVTEG